MKQQNLIGVAFLILFVVGMVVSIDVNIQENNLQGKVTHQTYNSYSQPENRLVLADNLLVMNDNIIYYKGYYSIDGSNWIPYTLQGTAHSSSTRWLKGSSSAQLPSFGEGEHYIIAYSCTQTNGRWDCHDGKWQLHIIDNTVEETCNDEIQNQGETDVDCGGPCSACAVSPLSEGLDAHYAFDGGSVQDISGGQHHGTLYGATTTVGRVGSALSFDGANDRVDLGTYNIPGSAMTITAWVRSNYLANCDQWNDCRIISKATGIQEDDHYWMISGWNEGGTKLRFRLKTNGVTTTLVATSGNLQQNVWTHVAAVYDGNYMRLYKDGQLVGSTSKSGTISQGSARVWIGDNPPTSGSKPWNGAIDEVRIYTRALSAADIQELAGVQVEDECHVASDCPTRDCYTKSCTQGNPNTCQYTAIPNCGNQQECGTPGELLVLDEEFTITASQDSTHGGNGFHWWKTIPNNWPGNWRTPYDYYDGRFYMRYEVLSQPTSNSGDISFVMWQKDIDNDGDESEDVEPRIAFTGPGVYMQDTSPHQWWKHNVYGAVDWNYIDQLDRFGFATWKTSPFCQLSSWGGGCSQYQSQYFPLDLHVTIVAVPEGRSFSGWDCWLNGGTINPTKPGNTNFDFEHHYISNNLITGHGSGVQTASDYDNDGDLDFSVGARIYPTGMYWFENEGSFWRQHKIADNIPVISLGGADYDVDGDGWEDIISAAVWYENDGDDTFTQRTYDSSMTSSDEYHDIFLADMNNDDVLDVVTWGAKSGSYWYDFSSNPRGTWTKHAIEPNLPSWRNQGNELHGAVSPAGVGDLDGDGDNDVWGVVAWYENRNNGASFTRHAEDHTGTLFDGSLPYGKSTRTVIIDIDNDGDNDIVFSECDDVDSRAGILKNNGYGSFNLELLPKTLSGRRGSLHSLYVGDLNMDGSLDIVSAEQEDLNVGTTNWYVWTNTGSGWQEQLLFDVGLGGHDALFKDVDQDGDIDIISKVWGAKSHNKLGGNTHADYFENKVIDRSSSGTRLSSNINTGWVQHGGAYWETKGDMIIARQQNNRGGELISTQSFGDFEVVFDAWPDYSVDTGMYVRATTDGRGYQVTIDYQPNNPMGGIWLAGIGNTGDWDFEIKNKDEIQGNPQYFDIDAWSYIWKENDWNQFRVRVEGNPPTITTWINGWKVHEYTDTQTRLGATGRIALQVHDGADDYQWENGAVARFRNIKVYPLE